MLNAMYVILVRARSLDADHCFHLCAVEPREVVIGN